VKESPGINIWDLEGVKNVADDMAKRCVSFRRGEWKKKTRELVWKELNI